MTIFLFGEAIRRQRLTLGKTMDWVCEGICDVPTLSKLENGYGTLSYEKLTALINRLGITTEWLCTFISSEDEKKSALREEIISLNIQFERASDENKPRIREIALKKHDELKALLDKNDVTLRQLLYRSEEILGKEDGPYSTEESVDLLTKAIRETSKSFSLDHILDGLYSEDEFKLINQIATVYMRSGNYDKAISILKQLFRYAQSSRNSLDFIEKCIPLISSNYANALEEIKWYEEAIRVADVGIQLCRDYRPSVVLPDLIAIEAKCYYELGDREKCLNMLCQAYYIYQALGNEADRLIVENGIKNISSIVLP